MGRCAEGMRLVLRTVSAEGMRWVSDGAGHRREAIRPGGCVRVGGGLEAYELDCLPGQRERLERIAGALALALGARRVMVREPSEGRVVVVAEVGNGSTKAG